jgi:hypothetical protein
MLKKLSPEEQGKEVVMLNPKPSTSNPSRNLRDSSVAQVAKRGAAAGDYEKIEDEDKEEKKRSSYVESKAFNI